MLVKHSDCGVAHTERRYAHRVVHVIKGARIVSFGPDGNVAREYDCPDAVVMLDYGHCADVPPEQPYNGPVRVTVEMNRASVDESLLEALTPPAATHAGHPHRERHHDGGGDARVSESDGDHHGGDGHDHGGEFGQSGAGTVHERGR